MPDTHTHSEPEPSDTFVYVPPLHDAADEAAHRLNVVNRMLLAHLDDCGAKSDADDDPNSSHGYEIAIMSEALIAIRDLLLTSLKRLDEDTDAAKERA